MVLNPGGRLTLDNPDGLSYVLARSGDGDHVGIGAADTEPVMLPIAVLKWLLQCCGYIVIEREDLMHYREKEDR